MFAPTARTTPTRLPWWWPLLAAWLMMALWSPAFAGELEPQLRAAVSAENGLRASGLGVLIGGVLTDYLDWRWCMYVNLPVAALAAGGVLYAVRPVQRADGVRVDIIRGCIVDHAHAGST